MASDLCCLPVSHCTISCCQGDANIDAAWTATQQLQAAVSAFTTSSNDTGLRMAGIKMSEQAAVLYTAPEALALPDAAALVTTAGSLVKVLVELLKEPAVLQLPGPVAICCIKALGAVVMQRANMMHRGMPALLALATKVKGYRNNVFCALVFAITVANCCWAGCSTHDGQEQLTTGYPWQATDLLSCCKILHGVSWSFCILWNCYSLGTRTHRRAQTIFAW